MPGVAAQAVGLMALLGAGGLALSRLSRLSSGGASRSGAGRADEVIRTRAALDRSAANIMVADGDGKIVYLNQSIQAMLRRAEADIRKELPAFSTDRLIGTHFDVFHKNPAHQRALLDRLQGTHHAVIKIGGRTFKLAASPLFGEDGERSGTVVDWHDITEQVQLESQVAAQQEAERRLTAEAMRARIALDNTTTNVMIADAERRIVYANHAVMAMLQAAEPDLRQELPGFSCSSLLGSSVDAFHKNPSHQHRVLASLTGPARTTIQVSRRTFRLVVTPIHDAAGAPLGHAVEWIDATAELKIQDEVRGIVNAAAAGDLTRRIDLAGKEGFLREVSAGINQLLDITSTMIDRAVVVMEALSRGDLTQKVTGQYGGLFRRMQEAINSSVSTTSDVLARSVEVMEALSHGDLTQTVNLECQGIYQRMQGAINASVAKLSEIVSSLWDR